MEEQYIFETWAWAGPLREKPASNLRLYETSAPCVWNMASSAAILLRRWSAAQFIRSRAVAYPSCSTSADRMINTRSGVVTSPESPAPWLMMSPRSSKTGRTNWRFYCFVKSKIYYLFPEECLTNSVPHMDIDAELVGSSHGWIASYNQKKRGLFLIDPITNRRIKLPPLIVTMKVHSVILDEGEEKAFITFGSGRSLAFCSLGGGGHEWILFGGGEYESVVYSSTHRRLFCISSTLKLEAWDVGGETETPRLDNDWVAHLDIPANHRPARPDLTKLNYIVCAEQSGELFVVVRHVKPGAGSWVERGVEREYVGPTVDFEVYKIDEELKLMWMEDCLEGVTMFVGTNHPIAMKDIGGGVKPDTIYFGYDGRVRPLDDSDYGIFYYPKRALSPHKSPYRSHNIPGAVWFTPRRHHNI